MSTSTTIPNKTGDLASPSSVALPARLDLRAHRGLAGPYTAGAQLLRVVVPALLARSEREHCNVDLDLLLRRTAPAVASIAPDLAASLPGGPQTLTNQAQGEERTRYYSVSRTRELAHVVGDLVRAWAGSGRRVPVALTFWDLAAADPTDTELIASLRRRCTGAVRVDTHPTGPPELLPADVDLAQHYVDSDGTTGLAEAEDAYLALPDDERRRRHDARAERLSGDDGVTTAQRLHHLEHGSDPEQALRLLRAELDRLFGAAMYDGALDLAQRGRALAIKGDEDWTALSHRAVGALTYMGRREEALVILGEIRRSTTDLAAHMRCAYMTAMFFTRFLPGEQQDQSIAQEWANLSIALADGNPDPAKRAFYGAFMRNGKALVVMHQGDLAGSLTLVNEAIAVADASLASDAHALHRSVLVYNKARTLAAMRDYDGALEGFAEVVERDPDYEETYFDRAAVHRARGDLDSARQDLTTAIELSLAFQDAHHNLADVLLELGDDDAAAAELDITLDIDPDHVDALINRIALCLGRGEFQRAQVDVDHGLAIAPESPHLWSARGLLELELGKSEEAYRSFGRAVTLAPRLVQALANRAVLSFQRGEVEAAVADLDTSLDVEDSAPLRTNRGIGLHELGHFEAAIDDFTAALEMSGDPEPLYRRALSRRCLADHEGSLADAQAHLAAYHAAGDTSPHTDELAELIEEVERVELAERVERVERAELRPPGSVAGAGL